MKPETKYANVLEAVRKADRVQWAVGDALIKDVDETKEMGPQMSECSELLTARGFPEFTSAHLMRLRSVARSFARGGRMEDVSWSVHYRCGNADNLAVVVAAMRKAGKPLTDRNVNFYMDEWNKKEKLRRESELAKANIDLEAAKFRKREAAEEELRTVNPEKRAAARAAKRRAEADEAEAQERRKSSKMPPKRSDAYEAPPPDNTALDVLARVHAVCDSAHKMRKRLRDNIKVIDDMIYLLEPESKEKIIESYREVDALVTSTLNRFEAKKGGLRAIKGGAA